MDLYGIIGNPLTHSFSPRFFTEKFLKERIDAQYLKFEITSISHFLDVVREHAELKGLNVTIPYKEVVMPFLDSIDPQAQKIGAINVIKFIKEDGVIRLVGYNSDIIGFQNSITPLLNADIHKKALILGTGGASKAVAKALDNLGVEFTYVSRSAKSGQLVYEDLNRDIIRDNTIIINTSPLGTFPEVDEAADIPYHFLTPKHLLYDLVYNPAETKFLRLGKAQGAIIKNGAEMLELQALAAWDIWNK